MADLNQVISRYRRVWEIADGFHDREVSYMAPVSMLRVTETGRQLAARISTEVQRLSEMESMPPSDAAQILLWLDGVESDLRRQAGRSPGSSSTNSSAPVLIGGIAILAVAMLFFR